MHSIFSWPFGTNTGRGGDEGQNLKSPAAVPFPRFNKGPSFVPIVIPIDLTVARINSAAPGSDLNVSGNFLMAYRAIPNDRSAVLNVQFDDSGATPTELRLGDFLVHPFDRLVITNLAQAAGSRIDLWVGQIDNNGFYPWLGKAGLSGGVGSSSTVISNAAAPAVGTNLVTSIGLAGQKIRVRTIATILTTGAGAPATSRLLSILLLSPGANQIIAIAPNTQAVSKVVAYQAGIGLQQADLGAITSVPTTLDGNQNLVLPDAWLDGPVIVDTGIQGIQAADQLGVTSIFWESY